MIETVFVLILNGHMSCYKAGLCTQVWAVLLRDRLLLTSPDPENRSVVVKNTVYLHDVVSHDFTRSHLKSHGLPHHKPTRGK